MMITSTFIAMVMKKSFDPHGNDDDDHRRLLLSISIYLVIRVRSHHDYHKRLSSISSVFSKRNSNTQPTSGEIIHDAIERARAIIFKDRFVPWMLHERNSDFEPSLNESKVYITSIDIHGPFDSPDSVLPLNSQDESYTLQMYDDGKIDITVSSPIGVVRAMETLTQLFYTHSDHPQHVYTNLAPLITHDRPRFHHRGLNLDVARNWYPLPDILRTIEIMSWNKLNVLHLHITDSQSWPLEIPSIPELAHQGAFRKGLSYSSQNIQQIQRHAALRGIEVILEVDMPGHTSSIGHAFPELITAFNIQPNWETYAAEPPSGQLKLNSSAVHSFVGKLLDDLLPRLKGGGATMFHTGGDEINLDAHLLDDTVRSNGPEVIRPLLQSFLDKVHDRVRKHGLVPVVWEEMLLDWDLELGKDVVVQTWRSADAVKEVVERGYKVIAGDYRHWYLDCGHGTWLMPRPASQSSRRSHRYQHSLRHEQWKQKEERHQYGHHHHRHNHQQQQQQQHQQQLIDIPTTNEPNAHHHNLHSEHQPKPNRYPFQDYCSPYKSWPWIYTYDPLRSIPSTYHDRVLGGEVHLWSELTDPVNLDGKLWPRASAAAEVLWSGGVEDASDEVEEEEEEEEGTRHDVKGRQEEKLFPGGKWREKGGREKFIDAATRLSEFRYRMVSRGVNAEVVIMGFCTQAGIESCTY